MNEKCVDKLYISAFVSTILNRNFVGIHYLKKKPIKMNEWIKEPNQMEWNGIKYKKQIAAAILINV